MGVVWGESVKVGGGEWDDELVCWVLGGSGRCEKGKIGVFLSGLW